MKEEQVKILKDEYQRIKQEQKEYQILIEKLTELEKNDKVKEYLSLLEKLDEFDKERMMETDERIIERAFSKVSQRKETNGIMVYMGTYQKNSECDSIHGVSDYRVKRDEKTADYSLYVDLENIQNQHYISITERENYENTHIILGIEDEDNKKYYKLQREFLKNVVTTSQEEALQKIKTRKRRG